MRENGPVMMIGKSFIGEGAEAAHINTMLGHRAGAPAVADVLAGREYPANPYYSARPAAPPAPAAAPATSTPPGAR